MTEQPGQSNFMTWEHTVSIEGVGVQISFEAEMPGYRYGEYIHSHSRYEVHIPKEDGLNVVFGCETVHISKGRILIIAPAVPHACLPENDSRKGFTYSFKDPAVSGFLAPLHFDGDYVVFPDKWDAMNMICKVEQVFQFADSGSDAQIGYLVSSLLLDFTRALTMQKEPAAAVQTTAAKNAAAKTAASIMDSFFTFQYNNQFQKKTLAKMLSASERQLERMIFTTYGMTFKEKVLKTRFEIANHLIRNFGHSIAETSEIIGYASEQSFCKAYSKYFGMTPNQYRKNVRKTDS
jgi:AraC-like DNA-binding protein